MKRDSKGRLLSLLSFLLWVSLWFISTSNSAELEAGFGEADITPAIGGRSVYLAGFGQNRVATKVHDPLRARAVVLRHEQHKLALVSVDLVGLFHPQVLRVRDGLPGFMHVLVSSTHNHEGPDTLGLWGPHPFKTGVDRDYLKTVEVQIIKAVQAAERTARPVRARLGTARAPELVHDSREPYVLHDELTAIEFRNFVDDRPAGLLVQWNCHPETLDRKNTEVSADYVGYTVGYLSGKYCCPVVYFTGTVGGLLSSLGVTVKDDRGQVLANGTFAKTERYGQLVGELAERALDRAKPVKLVPLEVRSREVYLPLDNKLYLLARQLGVLQRAAYVWKGEIWRADPVSAGMGNKPLCLRTEMAWLRLGELDVAAIPGEIYPELVLDRVQEPADRGADYPDAPIEPAIYRQMRGPHRLLIGLANDEIGYIIPKRQWDEKPPFCYRRTRPQYGEINSVGPETAPILCRAFKDMLQRN
jgi:hypothetical protein